MSDDTNVQKDTPEVAKPAPEVKADATPATPAPSAPVASTEKPAAPASGRPAPVRGQKRNFRSRAPRRERVKPEFEQKIISLRRVTRVMAGGRRFSFSVTLVIGDRQGRVGVGLGKATDTSFAIQKAFNDAKLKLVKLQLTDEKSIPHEVEAKFNSAKIHLRPNGSRGLVAGSALRTILEFAGIQNVTGRVHSRSRNKLNNARATMKALEPFVIARGADAQPKKPAPAAPTGRPGKPFKRPVPTTA